MTIQEAIELGKTKIDPRNNDLGENPERIYEILGFTNAKFFGWNTIRHIRHFEYHFSAGIPSATSGTLSTTARPTGISSMCAISW